MYKQFKLNRMKRFLTRNWIYLIIFIFFLGFEGWIVSKETELGVGYWGTVLFGSLILTCICGWLFDAIKEHKRYLKFMKS